jgi:SnoaL-like domain
MPTDDTARVARAYYDAWTNRKGAEALRKVIGEEFVFDTALMHIEGRDKFLAGASAGSWPEQAVTTLLAEAYDGEHAFQLYTATNGGKTVKIADHLTVRDGQLVSSEVIVDNADFMAFMAG